MQLESSFRINPQNEEEISRGDEPDAALLPELAELTLFTAALRLRSAPRSTDPTDTLRRALFDEHVAPGLATMIAAPVAAGARLRRAQTLLREADAWTPDADPRLYARCFQTAWDEWRWVGRSWRIRRRLLATAKRLGLGASAVDRALASIADELLPALLLCRMALETEAGLAAWAPTGLAALQFTAGSPSALVVLFAHLLPRFAALDQGPALVHEVVIAILARAKPSDEAADVLLRRYHALLTAWLRARSGQVIDFEAMMRRLRRLEPLRIHPDLLGLHAALLMAVLNAEIKTAEPPALAVRVAQALLYNPYDRTVHARRDELLALPDDLFKQLSQHSPQPAVQGFVDQLRSKIKGSFDAVKRRDGVRLAGVRRTAVLQSIAVRLTPPTGSSIEPSAELGPRFEALSAALADDVDLVEALETAGLDRPELLELDWDDLASSFTTSTDLGIRVVERMLPRRPEPDADVLVDGLRRSFLGAPRAGASLTRRTQWLTWLFSPADWASKAAASLGLALVVHATVVSSLEARDRRALDRAYLSIVESVRATDDSSTLAASEPFLAAVAGTKDPRLQQVERWRDEAMIREIMRQSEAGETTAVQALLARIPEAALAAPGGAS